MRLTTLAEQLGGGARRCDVCQWRCVLGPGETGRCLARINEAEGIVALNDGLVSGASIGPVEDFRLWHLLPGTPVLAIGSWGYAFPADQQRGPYARVPEDAAQRRRLEPERAATFALERLCRGVVWTYSDPSVAHEYALDLLRLARAASRFTAIVTTGYHSLAALDQIGHYLDGMSLEVRAFDDAGYARLAGVAAWRGILEVAARARARWGCHIEVTTRLHPGVNDGQESLAALAGWIRETLGPDTPWHVLPGDAGAAAAAAAARARRLAHEAGLRFVYGADPHQSTICPRCGAVVIARGADGVRTSGLADGGCAACGEHLHIRTSIFKR